MVSTTTLYRSRKHILNKADDAVRKSYRYIPEFLKKFSESSPGAFASFQLDDINNPSKRFNFMTPTTSSTVQQSPSSTSDAPQQYSIDPNDLMIREVPVSEILNATHSSTTTTTIADDDESIDEMGGENYVSDDSKENGREEEEEEDDDGEEEVENPNSFSTTTMTTTTTTATTTTTVAAEKDGDIESFHGDNEEEEDTIISEISGSDQNTNQSNHQSSNLGSSTTTAPPIDGLFTGTVTAVMMVSPFAIQMIKNEAVERRFVTDVCHPKSAQNPFSFIALMTRDGFGHAITLALGLITSESKDNLNWFFQGLYLAGLGEYLNNAATVFVTDGGRALLPSVAESFPLALNFRDMVHILRNLKLDSPTRWKVYQLMTIPTIREFCASMAELESSNPKLHSRLERLCNGKKECWTTAYSTVPLFGDRTSNLAESTMFRLMEARELPSAFDVLQCFERQMILDSKYHYNQCKVLRNDRTILTSKAQQIYDLIQTRSVQGNYRVEALSHDSYKVVGPDRSPIVVLRPDKRTCTCNEWRNLGIPCVHANPAAGRAGKLQDVAEWCKFAFHPMYLMTTQIRSIHVMNPVDCDALEGMADIQPPPQQIRPGRPRIKRIRSNGETNSTTTSTGRIYRCSNCRKVGHRFSTCTAVLTLLTAPANGATSVNIGTVAATRTTAAVEETIEYPTEATTETATMMVESVASSSTQSQTRRQYGCSKCRQFGHRAPKCPRSSVVILNSTSTNVVEESNPDV